MPLAGLTAWQALVDTLHVGEGDRVLITAASGGVGHLAVQIAKARGAEVWATASASKHDLVRELGADHLIDHHNERFEEVATDMDAVFDLHAMGDNPTRCVPAANVIAAAEVSVTWMLVEPDYASLEQLALMMSDGTLRVIIGETRPLAQMDALHTIGLAGGPVGKLVATVD